MAKRRTQKSAGRNKPPKASDGSEPKRPVGRPRKPSGWRETETAHGKPIEVQPLTFDWSAVGSIAKLPELDGEFSLSDPSPPPIGKLLQIIEDELGTALPNGKKMSSAGAFLAGEFGFRCRQLIKRIKVLLAEGTDTENAIALGITLGRLSIAVQVAEKEPDYVTGRKFREASGAGAKSRKKPTPPITELKERLQNLKEGKHKGAIEILARECDTSPGTIRNRLDS